MPRVNDRRVAHKSTGGIPPKIPTPVGPVGNAPSHLTPNTVALPANESLSLTLIRSVGRNSPRVGLHLLVRWHRRRPSSAASAGFREIYLRCAMSRATSDERLASARIA
jgi:hypothetical protein